MKITAVNLFSAVAITMIYFDNSATTRPYKEVLDTFITASTTYFANPSSIHGLGGEAERLLSQSRNAIANLLNVKSQEIIFTSGGTEGNNLAIKGVAAQHANRGKHLITSKIEHSSVLASFQQLEKEGFTVTYLPVNQEGLVSVADVKKAIRPETILVSIMHVNSEMGAVQPIAEIGKLLKDYPKIIFHVDHVQGIGKVPLSFENIDLCTMSGHKFHSVKGTGILYKREGISIAPLFTGGTQERSVRPGTENMPAIVAMAKALRMAMENCQEKQRKLREMKAALIAFFTELPNTHINSSVNTAPHILNVSLIGLKPEVIVHAFAEKEIYLSTKSACSSKQEADSYVLGAMGLATKVVSSAIRISFSDESTMEEVDHFKKIASGIIADLHADIDRK